MAADEMRINPTRAKELGENLSTVLQSISKAQTGSQKVNFLHKPQHTHADIRPQVRLIAVSKLKPANDILALHSAPHNHLDFGENYAQELTEKASLLPRTIRWHMIGALQTNKCKPLAEQVSNLYCVSSVDTAKKADALEKGRAALAEREGVSDKLRVLVQVNTSGEAEKSGVEPTEAAGLCQHVREKCPHLVLGGLMTIGAIARSRESTAETENEDFEKLREVRDALGKEGEGLELSMGMSADFEAAIRQGSAEVRVGTGIFGTRPAKKDAVVQEAAEEGKP